METKIYHGVTSDARPSYWAMDRSHASYFSMTLLSSEIDLAEWNVVEEQDFPQEDWEEYIEDHPGTDAVLDHCDGKDTWTLIVLNDSMLGDILTVAEAETTNDEIVNEDEANETLWALQKASDLVVYEDGEWE